MSTKCRLVQPISSLALVGPHYCQLYNDPYRPVLGGKHPASMGQRASECFPEIWDVIGPLIDTPFNGGSATWQIYEVLLKMLDRWNAHDMEGHLEVYWKSPDLLVVIDSEEFNGWQELHDSYVSGYPDGEAMGFIEPKRILVKLLKPDLALALIWWSASFPGSRQTVVANTTMNLQKFNEGWKIVDSHTSSN